MPVFVNPVVFGFAGGTQFELVAGDHGQWNPETLRRVTGLAGSLAADVQHTCVVTGLAERRNQVETCLVAIPVEQVETASGRGGLSVVLGVVLARKLAVEASLPIHAAARLEHVLIALSQGRGLEVAAELLTRTLQGDDSAEARVWLRAEVEGLSRRLTHLLQGYERGRKPLSVNAAPYALCQEAPAILLRLLTHGRYRSGADLGGRYVPDNVIAPAEPGGLIVDHYLAHGGTYTCFPRTTPKTFLRPRRRK
ncbi:hypothetical protein ED92_23635 [Amycolatopsis sp. MJM2582]|uniref:hypothetical protein n=1 Tax=Amycolatopsis TaxID=1813 RepID=UPI0005016372|nr:hypothetical protein [Amycolatopsis sp. MJM2582]KFZ80352.1 hypothetical protein ED92_23635 [Amycolatopsis sp. MJM2582]